VVTEQRQEMVSTQSLVACWLVLFGVGIFTLSGAHCHQAVTGRRHQVGLLVPGLVGRPVGRSRWRRDAMTSDKAGQVRRRKNHHRRRHQHAREADKLTAETINGLFGPARGNHPVLPLQLTKPAGHKHRPRHRHRHHKTAGNIVSSKKTFTMELPVGCEAEPCQHDGDCYTDASSTLGYSCRCQPGYAGDFCEIGKM